MKKKVYVLDSSAFIGGFCSEKKPNFTIPEVISEVKDVKSNLFLQSAVKKGILFIKEPDNPSMLKLDGIIKKSGDLIRLSIVDKKVLALALTLKKDKFEPNVVTDDYSMQNVLKILEIPYRSVLTEGIKDIYNWIKICKGCKKKYKSDYKYDECEICGSPIIKKRIKIN
ncbi:MAG: ribonuclease VapC [Methanobacteriaceae archaeon]|nr:ribonuclease VapC [Methanobacteriaceae archaeon]